MDHIDRTARAQGDGGTAPAATAAHAPGQVAARPYAWPYDGPLVPARTAVLVAWDGEGWAAAPAAARDRAARLAAALRAAGALVVALPPAERAGGAGTASTAVAAPPAGSPGPPAVMACDLAVARPALGGFCGTPLEYVLRTRHRRDLVLCGFPFELGADTTMREANDLGFECLAVEDASGGMSKETLAGAVRSVQMSGGIFGATATTAALLAALHPAATGMERP